VLGLEGQESFCCSPCAESELEDDDEDEPSPLHATTTAALAKAMRENQPIRTNMNNLHLRATLRRAEMTPEVCRCNREIA
jgi:hypothetical protein